MRNKKSIQFYRVIQSNYEKMFDYFFSLIHWSGRGQGVVSVSYFFHTLLFCYNVMAFRIKIHFVYKLKLRYSKMKHELPNIESH